MRAELERRRPLERLRDPETFCPGTGGGGGGGDDDASE